MRLAVGQIPYPCFLASLTGEPISLTTSPLVGRRIPSSSTAGSEKADFPSRLSPPDGPKNKMKPKR